MGGSVTRIQRRRMQGWGAAPLPPLFPGAGAAPQTARPRLRPPGLPAVAVAEVVEVEGEGCPSAQPPDHGWIWVPRSARGVRCRPTVGPAGPTTSSSCRHPLGLRATSSGRLGNCSISRGEMMIGRCRRCRRCPGRRPRPGRLVRPTITLLLLGRPRPGAGVALSRPLPPLLRVRVQAALLGCSKFTRPWGVSACPLRRRRRWLGRGGRRLRLRRRRQQRGIPKVRTGVASSAWLYK